MLVLQPLSWRGIEAQFTMNGMCAKNSIHIGMAITSNKSDHGM